MSRLLLRFSVEGVKPTTKGSLDAQRMGKTNRVRMVENVDPEGVFRTAVANAAYTAATGILSQATNYRHVRAQTDYTFVGPGVCIETRMRFWLPRPAKTSWWAPGQQRSGDVEKLVRNVHDALMDAGVLADDSQVTTLGRVAKRFAAPDVLIEPGVEVWIYEDVERDALAEDAKWFTEGSRDDGQLG